MALLIILVVLLVRPRASSASPSRGACETRRRPARAGALRSSRRRALLLPRFISDFRAQQFAYVGIYFIALLGLNLLTGITGQISLGHGAFMLIGGYTTAILMSHQDPPLELFGHAFTGDMRDIWTIPIAGLVAGLVGFLFGFPALRLTGLYLALATFAIAVAAPAVVRKFDGFTGGGGGIQLFELETRTQVRRSPIRSRSRRPCATVLGIDIPSFNEWLYYLCWTIAVVLFGVAWLLLRGRFGRTLRAVRDSELAAASSGVNLARYKTLAFGISAFYAGVAGSLLAIATTFVNPDTFPITLSIFLLVGVVVGGLGSLWPLVFGAIFIHFMQIEWAQRMEAVIPDFMPLLGDIDTDAPGAPAVAFGVVLILIMLAFPGGAAGLSAASVAGASRLRSRCTRYRRRGAAPRMRRSRLVLSLLVLAGAIATGATAAAGADPGITANTILLGGTTPLSGPASAYASVARGASAYFKYVNARGGVNGRTIIYKFVDDAYNPRRRCRRRAARRAGQGLRDLQLARHGAERGDPHVPEPAKVPQLFVASGATTFGRDFKQYPWTIGFQPSYRAEGWIYGKYLAPDEAGRKVAVLFQNDAYGKDLLAGLKQGIARSKVKSSPPSRSR